MNMNRFEIHTNTANNQYTSLTKSSCPQITLIHIVLHPVLLTDCFKKLSSFIKYFLLAETSEVQSVGGEHSSSALLLHLDCEECGQDSLEAVVVGVVR